MKRSIKIAATVLAGLCGLLLMIGTVGACELGTIGFGQALLQSFIGLALFGGAVLYAMEG